jgi:anti-sigma factor RsiW
MTLPNADESLLRRYLLGTVTTEAREGMEARLFSDDRLFWERISMAEDELVSDYVQNGLSVEEQQDFENNFLCTDERRAKVEFAKALHTYAEQTHSSREARSGWLRRPMLSPAWALAAAALLLLIIQVPRFMAGRAGEGTTSGVVAITLPPGLTRAVGGELTRVRLNANSRLVQLQLELRSTTYPSYRASLHHVDGDDFLAEVKLMPTPSGLTLTLPAELLAEGDYYVRLQGIAPGAEPVQLNRYDFRVLRD